MKTPEQIVAELEQKLNLLQRQLAEANKRISFLERENQRRKGDINQVARRG